MKITSAQAGIEYNYWPCQWLAALAGMMGGETLQRRQFAEKCLQATKPPNSSPSVLQVSTSHRKLLRAGNPVTDPEV